MPTHKPGTGASSADLLKWSDEPIQPSHLHTPVRLPPPTGVGSILLGAALTPEEAEALQKRKQNSELKKREISGSGIFSTEADLDANGTEKPMVRVHQPAGGVSQISFGVEGSLSPKRPTALHEVAKQRELSGNLEAGMDEIPSRKPTSTSKVKELVGSDIFGPPPEVLPRSLAHTIESNEAHTPIANPGLKPAKVTGPTLAAFGTEDIDLSAMKLNSHKTAELSGSNIFKDDDPVTVCEKSLSAAKRKEITGNDIFADEKPLIRDQLGGIRKPPGGESSLTLV